MIPEAVDQTLFDHVTIRVRDLAASQVFYAPVLAALDCSEVFEIEGEVVGYGRSARMMFEIADAKGGEPSSAVHVAFLAQDEAAVRAFYAAALMAGGRDNGPPGLRPQYEPGYFAAYVLDPDGHNLEAVFHVPADTKALTIATEED